MSSAGAAAGARAMRTQFQANYKKSMAAFSEFISKTESDESLVEKFHLIKYNMLFIPTRFLLIDTKSGFYIWQYKGIFNPIKHAQAIIKLGKGDLQFNQKSANIFERLNKFSIGSYLHLTEMDNKHGLNGKYIVENLTEWNFQDKARQDEFVKLYG